MLAYRSLLGVCMLCAASVSCRSRTLQVGGPWVGIETQDGFLASVDTVHLLTDSIGLRVLLRFDYARLQPEVDTTDPGVVRYNRIETAQYIDCDRQLVRDSETTLYAPTGKQVAHNLWHHAPWESFADNPMHDRFFTLACGTLARLGKLIDSARGA